jgi:hypothetical protein
MALMRLWRTIRYLTLEQWIYRFICRGRRLLMRVFPGIAKRRIEGAAARLALPDPGNPRLGDIAETVLALQMSVHGDHLEGIAEGRFYLLNQEFNYGSLDRVDWRGDFQEGNNPLRRMTLAYMGYAVPILARGGRSDLDTVCQLLRTLEEQNPFEAPGVFRDVWNAYTASHRLINLLAGLALYRKAGGEVDAEQIAPILRHTRFCAAFILSSLERDLQYNHLLKNYVALATYAAALDVSPAQFSFLHDAVPVAIAQNILDDGGHAERCPMYHVLSMLDVDALRKSGFFHADQTASLDDAASRMKRALAVMTHPDGDIALFNDSWMGEAPVLSTTGDADFLTLPNCGYTRIGRGDDAVLFDCGPCGPDDNPGHAHADFLSVELSVKGTRLLVDPGVPTYTAGPLRDQSRSAASHNGPHVKGVEPIEFWKSFRVGHRGRGYAIRNAALEGIAPLWCAGRQDGYAPVGIETRRFIGLWPGEAVLIADLWIGPPTDAASAFLIPDDWRLLDEDGIGFVQDRTRAKLTALTGALAAPAPAHHWPRFGVERPATRIDIRPHDLNPTCRVAALWISWSDQARAPDEAALAGLFDELSDC